ncbi:MAG TPA: sugar ABC transporter permease [Streptosporangiaceae bacterium]|nr:sugar ABC transporter permease [Streptosporangiaceae bacterium]
MTIRTPRLAFQSRRRAPEGARRRGHLARRREAAAGWLFTTPAVLLLIAFFVVPIAMAAWVSLSDWGGIGSPFSGTVHAVGLTNYRALLTEPGLPQQDLALSLRDNLYYVLLVVPLQTALALFLAIVVSRRALRGRGFFRTAFYFPSVTSSVAVSIVFLFLFSDGGVVNGLLGYIGVHGPNWFSDPSGVLHLILRAAGVSRAPHLLAAHGLLGMSWWGWLSGPSMAMLTLVFLAVWTTAGIDMLLFLPALYNIAGDIEEAALVDGAGPWTRFRRITLPLLRPVLFLVLTLGLIGTWQVFDQVFLMTQGNPARTTLTPAYLAYQVSFGNQQWGQGAAIAFILFAIILAFTVLQRLLVRERRSGRASPWGGA